MNMVLINGSPKGEKSCSNYLLDIFKSEFEKENNVYEVAISEKRIKDEDKFHIISNCDNIVIAFPLYVDCLPATVIKFLEGFEKYTKDNNIKCDSRLYCVVNCGFYEGIQNRQALKVVKNFTKHIDKIRYGGGIGVGTGPFIYGSSNIQWEAKIKAAVKEEIYNIIQAISNDELMNKDLFAEANMNKRLYIEAGNFGWISSGFKNKVYLRGFNNKPYKK